MAKLKESVIIVLIGKIGQVVGSKWKGISVLKVLPILFLLLIPFLEYGCKKENENEKALIEMVNPPRAKSGAENYASLIQKNTFLILKVVSDTTFFPYAGIEETQVNHTTSDMAHILGKMVYSRLLVVEMYSDHTQACAPMI